MQMKKTLLCFVAGVFLLGGRYRAEALEVSVSDASGIPGQTDVVVSIGVDDATGIAGGDFVLTYDPEVLTAKQVRTTALTSGYLVVSNLTMPGIVNISLASATGLSEGSGPMVEITFDVAPDAQVGSRSSLTLTSAHLSDDMGPIPIGPVSNGTFTVEGEGVHVVVSDASGAPGQSGVIVSIEVDDATGIAGGDFVLSYDPEVLTARQVEATELTSGVLVVSNLTATGEVRASLAGAMGISGGSGPIVAITFDVRADAEIGGSSPLKLTRVALSNEMARPIAIADISDGTFRIEVALPGDFNHDGQVNLADFSLFVTHYGLSDGDVGFDALYDLDGSGQINLNDFSIFVQNYGKHAG